MRATVSELTTIDPSSLPEESALQLSPFYELYLQLKQTGISNIAE
jgi:hypothetical protein